MNGLEIDKRMKGRQILCTDYFEGIHGRQLLIVFTDDSFIEFDEHLNVVDEGSSFTGEGWHEPLNQN